MTVLTPDLEAAVEGVVATDPTPRKQGVTTRRWATVSAVHTAPTSADAPWPSVDISLNGQSVPDVRHLISYAPVEGDTVIVDIVDGDPLVLGALA